MSAVKRAAAGSARAVFYASLLTLGVWLLWYGQYQWGGLDCKTFRKAVPGGAPAAWVLNTACALNWQQPVLPANVGFLFLVPAVAALAAIAIMGLTEHKAAQAGSAAGRLRAMLLSWGSTQLPPKRLWLWWCDGLTVKDALVLLIWAAYNAVWFSTILGKAFAVVPPSSRSPRLYAKALASLMMPNLMVLFFPVSRGSVINNVLGLSYPEGIRYHRWLGQWVLLLISLHGTMYWTSWAVDGRWMSSALRGGADTNNLLGGVALFFALLLWATSQEPVRRWSYCVYKALHHIGFWGFLLMGCAHHWALFWYFVPGMLLYAVDGVFRLHQSLAGRSADLNLGPQPLKAAPPGCTGINAEVLRAELDPAGTMCTLLLAAPEFGAAPAGIVWLNIPGISLTQWHAFDYTGSRAAVAADGSLINGFTDRTKHGEGVVQERTVMSVHIKAYSRWTRALMDKLAVGEPLTVRLQGPYADPPADVGQPDAVVLVAGGNGIASALPVFEELSAAGVNTQGLPALLIWACRKGYEFQFMAPKVFAAAHALGLDLTVQLSITDGADLAACDGFKAAAGLADTAMLKDNAIAQRKSEVTTLAVSSMTSSSSGAGSGPAAVECGDRHTAELEGATDNAAPSSLCPVVAFASFAAQLSFKTLLHLAVFGGFLVGIFITTYVAAYLPAAAGARPWPTLHLGPALVLITAGCAVGMGLITLWLSLFIQRRSQRSSHSAPVSAKGPAAAIAAACGQLAHLRPAAGSAGKAAGAAGVATLALEVPGVTAALHESHTVTLERPAVDRIMQGWLQGLQQLPTASAAKGAGAAGALHCVVYGCGPTPLDHATQLAVASIAGKQKRCRSAAGGPLLLHFVRKAQQL